jgi:hypothetical protein
MTVLRRAGKATLERLEQLGQQLAEKTRQRKQLDAEIAELRRQIAELASQYELPLTDGPSQYANVPSGYVRVTRPAPPPPKLLTEELYNILVDRLGIDEGRAVFLDVYVKPRTCEIDVGRWNSWRESEVVRDEWLLLALDKDREAPRPTVVFELGKQKEL